MKPTKAILALILPLLLLAACGHPKGNHTFDPSQVAFSAQYNTLFDGQLYPSMILAATSQPADYFSISLTAPADNCVLRLVVDSSALNYVTFFQEILPKKGEKYTFSPSLKWKYDALRRLRQPSAVDFTFTLFINDEEVDVKNLHLNCRSVNECPLSLRAPDGSISDFRYLFAAYVNEDHPSIPDILSDILDQGSVSRFSGYQSSDPNTVRNQVFSVWLYALSRGITYSSITCTSNPSPRANVQHIRFFDEVYSSRQANCVDACVFFASILRKIGLKPVIFVEPCHAYLGYYTDKNRKNISLLETTITSWVNFPALDRTVDSLGRLPDQQFDKISKYLSDRDRAAYLSGQMDYSGLKTAVARSLFEKATEYDRETYNANRTHFADSASITFQQLDIEQLLQVVQPIN
ncbi:MAG: hypothetical protein IKC19_01270 [Bacteroidales bacterium]|nr:hypothetical protein [Bacteroidales bacterium]